MSSTFRRTRKLALACGLMAAALVPQNGAAAKSFRVLYSFGNVNVDGAAPRAGLIKDTQDNLYGTTWTGGGLAHGNGTVFRLAPDGTETILHAFGGAPAGDGNWPGGELVRDGSGNLFGTTETGGIDGECGQNGCGTVFEVAADGTERVLYIFTGGNDGSDPMAALLPDGAGGFYGTAAGTGAHEGGVVFHLSSAGKQSVLYAFTGGSDGGAPESTLIADKSGNMYGTTKYGGACTTCGTVFEVTPGGTESVLYPFTDGSDGANPVSGLIRDGAGNFYGTAEYGGQPGGCGGQGCGTVFKLTPQGVLSVLYTFTGGNDGANPAAGLLRDGAGNLYGTALSGGARGFGVVYKLSPGGTETVLHAFGGGADGGLPWCTLLEDGRHRLVGTTSGGGGENDGVVFRIRK